MRNKIMISVVICAYNAEDFIGAAIESVFAQEGIDDPVEIIVVDDGSTDNTAKIVQSKNRANLHYHYRKNGGHTAAVNTAMQYVSGEYVCFLDADDLWGKEKLQAIIKVFESDEQIDLIYNYYRIVDSEGNFLAYRPESNNTNPDYLSDEHLIEHLDGRLPFKSPTSGISVRRICLEKILHLDEENIFPDLIIQNVLPFYARKIKYVRMFLHSYRLHDNNTWENKEFSSSRIEKGMDIREKIRKQVIVYASKSNYDVTKFISRIDLDINRDKVLLLRARGKLVSALWLALRMPNPVFDRHSKVAVYQLYSRLDLICQGLLSYSAYQKMHKKYLNTVIYRMLHKYWR